MSSGTRSRLLRILLFAVVIAVIREVSIRRHLPDLYDWPRADRGPAGVV